MPCYLWLSVHEYAGYLKEFKLKQGETKTYFFKLYLLLFSWDNSRPLINRFPLMEIFEMIASLE